MFPLIFIIDLDILALDLENNKVSFCMNYKLFITVPVEV